MPQAAVAEESSSDVQRARTRARQRLIGAAVLVAIGVIGFPLVFETQPRPIPVDIPIEIPRKEGAAPLVMPPARQPGVAVAPAPATGASASASVPMSVAPTPSARDEVITESRDDSVPSAASAAARSAPVAAVPAPQASRPVATPKPPTADARAAPPAADGARAQALLEGKAPAAASGARFVVQVGAFADAGAAREARA